MTSRLSTVSGSIIRRVLELARTATDYVAWCIVLVGLAIMEDEFDEL